jgi:hypothetical protein
MRLPAHMEKVFRRLGSLEVGYTYAIVLRLPESSVEEIEVSIMALGKIEKLKGWNSG